MPVLVAAVVSGAILRFGNLGSRDLSPDESASWIAASAPTIKQVLTVQARANPGELGLHDVLLHFWMGLFGDSLIAMRSLSALTGTLAIFLIYLLVRELLLNSSDDETGAEQERLTAAIAALFFAVNLVTIKYSREARMYPLALALTLVQVWCFLRALRRREFIDYAGMAIATALMIIATYTSGLVLIPEGLLLLLLLWRQRLRLVGAILIGGAIATGLLLVVVNFILSVHLRGAAPSAQTWEWIQRPAPWATITLFSKAIGTYAFPLLVILGAAGALRSRSGRADAIDFLLLWTFTPPLFLTLFSYAVRPAFVERYMISTFVPFFALAALGVFESYPVGFRPAAVALILVLSVAHIVGWSHKEHGMPWGAATAFATGNLKPGERIGVMPRNGINVVRYYVRDAKPDVAVDAIDSEPAPAVVIVTDKFDEAAALEQRYPQLLAFAGELVVRRR
ncbi:MAG TPA: glycosyltransferase family 39 protein [Candidatus Binataceae bacterium]|nr:glycosyltransferase family 39 protein [Candidatus Binataceae bacterium]